MDEIIEEKRRRVICWLKNELENSDHERRQVLIDRYDISLVGRDEVMLLDYSDADVIKFRNYRREGAASWHVVGQDKIDKIMLFEELPDA